MQLTLRFLGATVAALGTLLAPLASAPGQTGPRFDLPAASAAPSGPPPLPTWEDYRELAERLEAAERRLHSIDNVIVDEPAPVTDRLITDDDPQAPNAGQPLAAFETTSTTNDEEPSFPTARLSGFFHLDAGYFHQDPLNLATLGDIQDGVGFRRARLQAVGSVAQFTNYSVEMDFGTAGRPSFMDVWGEQTHLPVVGNLRIGHYRQPLTMDSLTSVRQLEFLERSLPFQAFDAFRRVGVLAFDKSEDERWTWAYSGYKTGGFNNSPLGDTRYATDIGDDGGYSFAGRATHLLWSDDSDDRHLLHIGGAYNYSRMTGSTAEPPFYQSRVIPEFFVGDPAAGGATEAGTPFFVDTGRLAADQYQLFNGQFAGQFGSAHFQAEYIATVVDQIDNPNVFYDGAYVQGGYFLTGEHRTYNRAWGVFDKVIPYSDFFSVGRGAGICGWGAWEATGRWSYVNLNDPNAVPLGFSGGPPASPNPGRMNNTTVGLNWFWNTYTQVQFNWIHCFLDNGVTGDSDCDIYCARFQIGF